MEETPDTPDPTSLLVAAADLELLVAGGIDPTEEATPEELAYRLDLAERVRFAAGEIADMIALHLNDTLESNVVIVPGVGQLVREKRNPSVKSNNPAAHAAARNEIVRRMSRDRGTGQMRPDWRDVAEQTFDLVTDSLSVGKPKGGFNKKLGLEIEQYQTVTPNGTTVRLVREDEE